MVKNIANTSDTYNSHPYEFQHFNGYLYFTADSGNSCNEGGKGKELWRTDGTEEGTVMMSLISMMVVRIITLETPILYFWKL